MTTDWWILGYLLCLLILTGIFLAGLAELFQGRPTSGTALTLGSAALALALIDTDDDHGGSDE